VETALAYAHNQTFVHNGLLTPDHLVASFGHWAFIGILAIIFAECGLLIGLVLPGDSLLFVTGMLIAGKQTSGSTLHINVALAIALIAVAAILGNLLGYQLGAKFGPGLFNRPQSRIFRPEYVTRTHEFFDKFGPRAIVLARFTPVVRTLITAVAGIAGMPFRIFAIYSVIGGVLWAAIMTGLGYTLGQSTIHGFKVQDHLESITIGIVLVSIIPIGFELLKARKTK
jgi:membrane-associated protein